MPSFSSTDLLTRIRRAAILSGSEAAYTDSVLLDLAYKALVEEILPGILSIDGDYFLMYSDYSVAAGRNSYPIPSRASFGKIHSVEFLDSAKTASTLLFLTDPRGIPISSSGAPTRHVFRDNSIILADTPSTTGYLRIWYPYTPSGLVATTAVMQITGGEDTGILTGSPPTAWTTADSFDIVSGRSPYELVNADLTASAITASTSVTFTLADLNTNRLSDGGLYYVTLAQESAYPMIPKELHYILADLAACPVLQMCGDEGWQELYQESHKRLEKLLSRLVQRKQTESPLWLRRDSITNYFV